MGTSRVRSKGSATPYTAFVDYTLTECQRTAVWDPYPYRKYVYSERSTDLAVQCATVQYHDDRQTISDVIGEFGRYNACSHTKFIDFPLKGTCEGVDLTGSPYASPAQFGWSPIGYTNIRFSPANSLSFQSTFGYPNGLTVPTMQGADWSTVVDQVGSQLDGRMTTGQNLVVSLSQIAQTVGMIKNPFGMRKLAKSGKRGMALGAILKLPANAFLEYEFGWKNLWRDYLAIAKVWSEVSKHQTYLQESVNKFVPIAARQSVSNSTPLSLGYLRPINSAIRIKLDASITRVTRDYCFSLDLKRTEAMAAWSKFDQVLSRLGVNDLATALWDLVPYSFVVDWFTHINRIMERGPISWLSYDLRNIGYSTKTYWEGSLVADHATYISSPACPYVYAENKDVLGTSIVQKTYERCSGFPPGTASVGLFGNLSKTQIAEGIALIIQRL